MLLPIFVHMLLISLPLCAKIQIFTVYYNRRTYRLAA